MAKKITTGSFEASIERLESIVEAIENGDLSLELAMTKFEEGVKLARECHQALQAAEQKVQILLEKHGDLALVDFDSPIDNELEDEES